jgi:hypothetical protein
MALQQGHSKKRFSTYRPAFILLVPERLEISQNPFVFRKMAEFRQPLLKISQIDGVAILGQDVPHVLPVYGSCRHHLVDDHIFACGKSNRAALQRYFIGPVDGLALIRARAKITFTFLGF